MATFGGVTKPAAGVDGTDISTWDDAGSTPQRIDFVKMKAAGAKFVFIKASQGNWADDDFLYNWKAAKAAGLLRGAFHFHVWNVPIKEQAAFFCGLLQQDPGELPPVFDFENRIGMPGPALALFDAWTWLTDVRERLGRKPMLYFSPSYWVEKGYLASDPKWAEFGLWLAHYGTTNPWIPKPWTKYTFWQYSAKGNGIALGGEAQEMDLNLFNGTEAELMAFAGQQPPVPPQTIPLAMWAAEAHNFLVKQGYQGKPPQV